MSVEVAVTNHSLYQEKVEEVDVTGLIAEGEDLFTGGIYIYSKTGKTIPFYGLIGETDFEEAFGFILKKELLI